MKTILNKVSFDSFIFEKELRKAIRTVITMAELREFKKWCYQQFGEKHRNVLNKYFMNS